MDLMEDSVAQFAENQIDIQEEMPVPKEEVVDIKADDSDLDIIEVHCNLNPNRTSTIRKRPPNKFRRKIQKKLVNHLSKPQQDVDGQEAIVISDSSDTECDPLLIKKPKPGYSTRRNKDNSLSSITLNCPKCNVTKTVFTTTLISECKDCKVNMNFVCNECNQNYETLIALFRHKKMQCKKAIVPAAHFMHKCGRCLVKHKIYTLSKPRNCLKCKKTMSYECVICSKEMQSQAVIYKHVKDQCQPQCRTFFCNDCSYKANNERSLLLHFSSTHQNLYLMNESCDQCGKGFANYYTLSQHKMACGVPYFYCKFCPYRPRLKLSLQRHLMLVHKIVKADLPALMVQSNCPPSYSQVAANTTDTTTATTDESAGFVLKQLTEATCTECNHTQPIVPKQKLCNKCKKPLVFQCLYCPMRFRNLQLLQRHARRMHGKVEYACKVCNKPYSFFGDYNAHQKWCGKEPRFKCHLCPFKTRYRHNLKGHLENLHDSNRPVFMCQDCGVGYKTEKGMSRHFEIGCGAGKHK